MKNILRGIICLILIALMSTSIISCTDEDNTGDTSEKDNSEETELFGNLPDKFYDDEEIVILVEGDYMEIYQSVEVLPNESSPSIISDAVLDRNSLVEEKFGVKIKEVRTTTSTEMVENVRNEQASGSGVYDLVMPYIPQAATLASTGYFHLLNELPNINLDQPYWDQGSIDGLSINRKNYFASGDFSLLSMACTHALVFNKDVVAENDLENPYDLVKEGDWTIDKLREMAKKVTYDSDGTPGMTSKDTYGFLVNTNFVTSMFVGSGERISDKDAEDIPFISVNTTRGVDVFNKIFELVNDPQASGHIESFQNEADSGTKTHWQLATEAVANKRVLFRAMSIVDMLELGEYETNFGILPTPKYDQVQTDYFSNASTIYASCAAIPVSNTDVEQASIILDAICQASTHTLRHSYYQVMLKDRKIQDNESEEMLDIIFDNRVYDLGIIYGWGGAGVYDQNSIANFMNGVAFSGTNTFTSTYDSIKGKVQADLDATIDEYEKS